MQINSAESDSVVDTITSKLCCAQVYCLSQFIIFCFMLKKKKKKAVCLTDELHALHFLYLWRAVVLNPAQIVQIKYWIGGACNH